jgi:hypothetical protein
MDAALSDKLGEIEMFARREVEDQMCRIKVLAERSGDHHDQEFHDDMTDPRRVLLVRP